MTPLTNVLDDLADAYSGHTIALATDARDVPGLLASGQPCLYIDPAPSYEWDSPHVQTELWHVAILVPIDHVDQLPTLLTPLPRLGASTAERYDFQDSTGYTWPGYVTTLSTVTYI